MRVVHDKINRRTVLSLIMVFALTLTACAGDEASEDIASELTDGGAGFPGGAPATTVAVAATRNAVDQAETDDSSGLGDGGVEPVVFDTADLGRDIIFTADMTVAVRDVAAAGDEATRMIQSLGGFLFGQRTTGSPDPMSVLTFKVFPEDFQEALDRLGSIGELRDQNVTADDVTERVVDIQSRINTAEASVERLRAFLEQATDIDTIAELENQLLQRETQLETLRGQLRTLQDQVALATITLTLTEAATRPSVRVDVSAYPGHEGDGASCPGTAGLTVDKGGQVTVCFEIVNVGDTDLRGFTLRDRLVDLELDDLTVVFGDPNETIVPGESIVLAGQITVDRSIRTQTTVTAIPVDEDGLDIAGRSVSNTASIAISAVDPGGIPSFADGLEGSWRLLVMLGQILILVAGSMLPFVPLLAAGWFVFRWFRRRSVATTPPQPRASSQPVGADTDRDR